MGIFRKDISATKQYCLDLLEQLKMDQNHPRYNDSAKIVLDKIVAKANELDVDAVKLHALLRSMLFSGHIAGAEKVIRASIPDKPIRRWPLYATVGVLGAIAWYIRNA